MPEPLFLHASRSGARSSRPPAADLLGSLWEKFLPLMRERLGTLDAALQSLENGELHAEQRHAALDAAHKFAGSLGMFGFAQGTDAARSIEHLLLEAAPYDPARIRRLVNTLHEVLDQ